MLNINIPQNQVKLEHGNITYMRPTKLLVRKQREENLEFMNTHMYFKINILVEKLFHERFIAFQ